MIYRLRLIKGIEPLKSPKRSQYRQICRVRLFADIHFDIVGQSLSPASIGDDGSTRQIFDSSDRVDAMTHAPQVTQRLATYCHDGDRAIFLRDFKIGYGERSRRSME